LHVYKIRYVSYRCYIITTINFKQLFQTKDHNNKTENSNNYKKDYEINKKMPELRWHE